jgi:hypothetical protein
MASSTPRDREPGVVEGHEGRVVEGVQTHGDAAQARRRQRPGLAGEQRPVGRQGDDLDAVDSGQHRDQPLGVLGRRRAAEQDKPVAEPNEDQIEQAEGHG